MQQYPGGIGGLTNLEGHLEMKGRRWKCYFVQLVGRQMFLYHDFNANPTLIQIVDSATCKMGKSKKHNYQFSLHMGKTTYHFRAPNELHRATWMMHILEASKAVSPRRQPSQRSIYSISSISSVGSFGRYADDFFVGAPTEYVQFCRRTLGGRSPDSCPSPAEELGRRSRFTRRSLADCHLPLNNMRWYESAPPTPLPLMSSTLSLSDDEGDADIISLPDISTALLREHKPKQNLQRAGAMDNLETLDLLSQADKFQDLSSLDFAATCDKSHFDNYADFIQWPDYNISADVLNTTLLQLAPAHTPRFHRSASLPHSLSYLSAETNTPLQWNHTRTQPTLSVLSEKHTPDTITPHLTPQNFHPSLERNNTVTQAPMGRLSLWPGNMELYVPPDEEPADRTGTNGCVSVTSGYSMMKIEETPDYENVPEAPPQLPKRSRDVSDGSGERDRHKKKPEVEPQPSLPGLKRSVLRSISRRNAEEILRGMAVGTFLVRNRESSPDKLALSIHMEDGIRHHKIHRDTTGAYSIEGFACREDSLDSLLRAFIRARRDQFVMYCPEEPLSDEDAVDWDSNNSLDFIL